MKRLILILAGAAVLATTVALPIAYAHGGHHALRTRRQCKHQLPRRWHHMRAECYECVERGHRHHFHPGFPEGERCHR